MSAAKKIRVNSLAPGYVLTDLVNHIFVADDGELSAIGKAFVSKIPSQSFVGLQDLEGPLVLLASAASRGMTGSTVVVDGGHLCSSL